MTKRILFSLSSCILIVLAVSVYGFVRDCYGIGNFRSYADYPRAQINNPSGLENLHVSGSKICRLDELKLKLNKPQNSPIYILDTLLHGQGYIAGLPDFFLGYDRNQDFSVHSYLKFSIRRLIFTGTSQRDLKLLNSEKEECDRLQLNYLTAKYQKSGSLVLQDLIKLIDIVRDIPENAWIHVHCKHGRGRTTMAMVALDIIKNAPQVPLEDIIQRQHAIGGENLFNTTVWKNGTYTKEDLVNRKQVIIDFYNYVVVNQDKVRKASAKAPRLSA